MRSVADLNPYWGRFYKDWLHLTILHPVVPTIVLCVQPKESEGHADLASSPPSSPVREQSRLASPLEGSIPFGLDAAGFLTLVRFFVCRRIEPHNPPLVRVPVYSFEF